MKSNCPGSYPRGTDGMNSANARAACGRGYSSQSENSYFTEMCSGSEASSYLKLIDFVYHSTLGLRVI